MKASPVDTIQAIELKKLLDKGFSGLLLDVRTDWEHGLSAIPQSTHIPLSELIDRYQEICFEDEIIVYCHHGERSHRACLILQEEGVSKVSNLVGGIDAYSQVADPNIPRYNSGQGA